MNNDLWKRVQAEFEAALDLDGEAREARLGDLLREDPELEREVRRMLAGDEGASPVSAIVAGALDQIEVPNAEGGASSAPPSDAGREIGPYRLVERIGRGGMGDVYLAHRADGDFEQKVAIKLIKRGMDSDEIVARFHAERRILARLVHPNIAQMLHGGVTDDGRPWFSMEYVPGRTVLEYAEAEGLGVEARLNLFAVVCDAVQFAHRNLVVHRDLKPNNLVVSDDGVVKLLDFGIAKVVAGDDDGPEATALTRHAARPMTPAYAAPEQLRGEPATTATDVYALGILLYELLSGRRPYQELEGSGADFERAVQDSSPTRPSLASSQAGDRHPPQGSALRGELDDICLMALRREPERRYASAGDLARDVRRFLEGKTVSATPDSLGYRVRTFVRRHKAAVVGAAAALVVTSSLVTWYTLRLQEERALAQTEAAKAEQVAGFLQSMFQAGDLEAFTEEGATGLDITVGQLLDRGVERIGEELGDQPEVRASMLMSLGTAYLSLGEYPLAMDLLERAVADMERFDEPDPMMRTRALSALGNVYFDAGMLEQATASHEEALALMRVRAEPDDFALGIITNDLALVYLAQGRIDDAAPMMAESLENARANASGPTANLGVAISNYADVQRQLGHPDSALALHREGLAMVKGELGPRHPSVASITGIMGSILLEDLEDAPAAEALYREALSIRRESLGEDHPWVAISLNELAAALVAQGRLDEAEPLVQDGLALRRRALEPGHPHIAYSLAGYADLLMKTERAAEAEPLLREALTIRQAALPADHWLIADTESVLGACLASIGRTDEGQALMRAAVDRLTESLGADDRRTRAAVARLGTAEG